MTRRLLFGLMATALFFPAYELSASGTLSGGVTFFVNMQYCPPTVNSVGDASYSGTESYTLVGEHQIVNVTWHSVYKYESDYFLVISGTSDYYDCHTASLHVGVFPTDIENTWIDAGCVPAPPGSGDNNDDGSSNGSPILIAFGGNQDWNDFHLSGPDDPVLFDILADGSQQRMTWTRRGARVGFLALDRNGDSQFRSGAELFGNHTPIVFGSASAPAPARSNGYFALSVYDYRQNGGNEDGHIGPEDAIWSSLRIWIDRNHDAVSGPSEVMTLDEAGIEELGLTYNVIRQRDRFGNLFRYAGTATAVDAHGGRDLIPTYDVFFRLLE